MGKYQNPIKKYLRLDQLRCCGYEGSQIFCTFFCLTSFAFLMLVAQSIRRILRNKECYHHPIF